MTQDQPAATAFQNSPTAQWMAVLIGALPLYAAAIGGGLAGSGGLAKNLPDATAVLQTTTLELLLFGGLMLACLYIINGQSLGVLNQQRGTWYQDVAMGIGGMILIFCAVIPAGLLLRSLGLQAMPQENIDFGRMIAQDSSLRLAVFGPLLWLKAALLEEFSRVFMLTRLWRIYGPERPAAQWMVLLGVSALFGAGHIWQGWAAVAVTALIGFVLGLIYMRFGRFWQLVIAHGCYDSLVMLTLVAIGSGAIPLPPAQ